MTMKPQPQPYKGQRRLVKALQSGSEAVATLPAQGRVSIESLSFAPLIHNGCFALKIVGDCLTPHYFDGDIAIVDPDNAPEIGKLAVFFNDAGDATVKFLNGLRADGFHVLMTNPESNLLFPSNKVAKALRVLGVVSPSGHERAVLLDVYKLFTSKVAETV